MDQPRGPTNKKVPVRYSAKRKHRDNLGEAIDCNCLRPHHTKSPSEIQTKLRLRELLAQFDNPAQPLPLPPAPTGTGEVGKLIDQCLARISHHQEIAEYHQTEADRHRAILRQLESLIPARRVPR